MSCESEYEVRPSLYYTENHTWAQVMPDGLVKVGVTDYAQKMLRTVTRVRLEMVDTDVEQFGSFGVIESIKAVSDLTSPLSGKIKETNDNVLRRPFIVNRDPYGAGWMMVLEPTNLEEELGRLLSAEKYQEMIRGA